MDSESGSFLMAQLSSSIYGKNVTVTKYTCSGAQTAYGTVTESVLLITIICCTEENSSEWSNMQVSSQSTADYTHRVGGSVQFNVLCDT